MAVSEKELELQLMEAGNRLVEPPPSVDELIPLLDQVESCLSRVEQSPSQSMQNALSPSLKALVAEHLFRHPDVDVKVAVAACISEITRITAPDAPFDDDQMREVFQLIVSSFENLSDKCSRSYIKRTSILETVAKVRSCVVMLDLECDDLIVEMFQHFLKAIRDYHPLAVFTSMVTIMSLVLEESEDIPMELLSSILASVKIDNEEVLPVARRLAEKVLKNCASKLRPYLTQAVENLGISYDYYSSVVASVCQVTARVVDSNDAASGKHLDDESILVEAPLEKAAQEDKQIPEQAVSTEKVDLANEKSPKAVVCNGILQTAEDDSLADLNSVKKEEGDHIADKSKNETSPVAEPYISKAEEVVNSDPMLEQNTQEKERKSDSKLTEPSDSSHVDEKAVETSKDQKNDSKDDAGSQHLSVGGAVSSENRKTDVQHSSQKATKEEFNDVASPTPSGTDSHSTRAARPKRKDDASKETTSSVDDVSKATSDSEAKTNRRSGKEVAAVVSSEDNAPVDVDETKKESDTASDSEAKSLKKSSKKVDSSGNNAADQTKKESDTASDSEAKSLKKSSKKVDSSGNNADESTSRQLSDKKRRGWGKVPEKDRTKTLIKKDNEASDSMEYGENLVGLKVKVWWPKDREFYEGFIYSFDPSKQKHKVHYNDGDQEILNLKREKWAVIEDESGSDEEGAANHSSPDGSSDMPQKKREKTSDLSSKKAKMGATLRRGGGTRTGKSKGAATKSGRKTKDDVKMDVKSKGGSKSVGKSDKDSVAKSKDHTPKTGGKSVDIASKVSNKSKNDDCCDTPKSKDDGSATPKASTKLQDSSKTAKSKQETPKGSPLSKGKPLKSGGKSNAHGTGKSKSDSSKVKDSEVTKENSTDSERVVGSAKRKASSLSKTLGSDSRSGKKQRR